jgi:N-acetylglucosamine-6-sulfatase
MASREPSKNPCAAAVVSDKVAQFVFQQLTVIGANAALRESCVAECRPEFAPRKWSRVSSGVLLAILTAACGGGGSSPSAPNPPTPPSPATSAVSAAARPNIVVVVADDLDFATTQLLPRLPESMGRAGLTFSRAYVTTALCAPSRASILTGQYAHNHRLVYNEPPDGGFPSFRTQEASTVATWLKAGGYRTALIGKYLNGYPRGAPETHVPAGWDYWFGHLSDLEAGRYYDYWMNEDGNYFRYGSRVEEYNTDVLTTHALAFIAKASSRPEPFFLYLGPEAPHTPAYPAERHSGEFPKEGCQPVQSFNEGDVKDKPAWIQNAPLLNTADMKNCDTFQRGRLRSMRAVEEMIDRVLAALVATGELENTYIFFTSDNGLLMGEHRLVGRKGNHYEESIHVPLMVRGPRVPAGRTLPHTVLNIDLAPTFAELAGISIPGSVDGRSLLPLLRDDPPALSTWRTDFLIEHFSSGISSSLRTPDVLYGELESGEQELYDMRTDPSQMESQHRKADPAILQPLSRRLAALAACRGTSCRS